jgi:tRNA threonylcarbamoyladenosine biosynthesis protein TsaE
MKTVVYRSSSPELTQAVGQTCSAWFQPGDCVPLFGDLGTGKTCFVKGVARGLGVSESIVINSPSFSLINQYNARIPLFHVDLYRLQSERELDDLELMDLVSGQGVTLIEWPQLIIPKLDEIPLQIEFVWDMTSERVRTLIFRGSSRFDDFFRELDRC